MNEQIVVEGQWSTIHEDILDKIFSRVPLIDLVNASRVSKTWEFSILSSLSHVNKVKPWLVIQTQNTSFSANKVTTHAYDPRSDSWIEVCKLSNHIKNISTIKLLGSSFLYELSDERLSFSVDPLHFTWHHIVPPKMWRVDPIVAVIGPHVIVAGGGSGLWDDPLTVEMYDMETSIWSTCQSMPSFFKDSAASTWLSVTCNEHKMYVTEKSSSVTYSFCIETKTWSRLCKLIPDQSVYFSTIGFVGNDLIIVGLLGHAQNVTTLKLWKMRTEMMDCNEIGEMPVELLEKLKGDECYVLTSVTLLTPKDFIYIYNTSNQTEIIFCEFVREECIWGSVKNIVLNDESKIRGRMLMSCGRVGIANLRMAMNVWNLKFLPKFNA